MSLRKLALGLVVLLMGVGLLTGGESALAVGVRPLVIEMNVNPGDEREFVIDLIPEAVEELVELVLYEPVQQLSGGLMYQLPEQPGFSPTSWVTFEESLVRVLPGQETSVRGTVRVPFSAGGSHTVVVMVETRPPEDPSGFTFRVRYAVRLRIMVERAGLRPTAELTSLEVRPDAQGAPLIAARFHNTSALDYLVSGEATIRDEARRLVERVTLRSPAGSSAGMDSTRVYPGAGVEFVGRVTRPLAPGEYWLQAFLRYGDSGQIIRNETIVVEPGQFVYPGFDESAAIIVEPATVIHELRAGERKSQVFGFESLSPEPVRIEVALGEVMAGYEYSLVDWLDVRSQPEFMLPARARTRLAMTIAVPRDALDGSYHGKAVFRAYSATSGDLLSEAVIPIDVLVGTEHRREVQVRSLVVETIEDGTYLSLDLVNSGNVAFLPQVSAVVYDGENDFVERVMFELQQDEKWMLPRQAKHLMAIADALEPGTYRVEIEVTHGGVQILKMMDEVVVEP